MKDDNEWSFEHDCPLCGQMPESGAISDLTPAQARDILKAIEDLAKSINAFVKWDAEPLDYEEQHGEEERKEYARRYGFVEPRTLEEANRTADTLINQAICEDGDEYGTWRDQFTALLESIGKIRH